MPQNEAEGRLNLYDDVTPLENTQSIDVLTRAIRKKTRGADVREAIAKAIETTYTDGTSNGNANLEVAKARGEYETLNQRLQDIQTTAKSSQELGERNDDNKVDKNGSGQIKWANLAQDAREQISGGKVAVVGNNAVSTSNIVDGAVTDTKLDERMGFGLMIAGRLLIDVANSQVELSSGSWFQVGKRKANARDTLTAPLPKTGLSQYVIYNDETNSLYVKTLNDIQNIGNRETILAILFNGALVHPQSSPFVKTVGLKVGERLDYVNADWGTVIQGEITFDAKTNTVRGQRKGDIIVSFQNYYINGIEDFEITLPNYSGKLLLFDRETKKFQVADMDSYDSHKKKDISKAASLIKVAEIYQNEIRHISSNSNIFLVNQETQRKQDITLERLKVDLQTKRTVIVMLGDSTTDGYRTSGYSGNVLESLTPKPNTYTEILNGIINGQKGYGFNHKFYNRGFSGKTIAWLKDNLDAVLAPITEKIDYAIISMGINDSVYQKANIQPFEENHIDIVKRLKSKGIKPILMSTQAQFENYNRFGSKINSIADNIKKDLAKELGIPFIDYNAGTRNILNDSEYSVKALIPDMCHFGDLGHQKSAEFLASQLIHRVEEVAAGNKIGYQNNRVVSDLNYSDYLSDVEKEVKFLPSKVDGFDLEGHFNGAQKTMFEVLVYVNKPVAVKYFGENVSVSSNGANLDDGARLDVGLYKISVKNTPNQPSSFRGLKFE
ncbi:SGNH/GDSL hydrolase family protein [Streptococcus sp. HMSC10E12]|uniref:SGNH/GDSL hydrolase family protein n=1 Tax=Streptococcus sp. HMSC10E12 TaxID=1581080 RepID=UPI0009F58BCE|nr:SGNH/GDSL hydrolase family protein [Streptococcus sp. HMSC10E12]